MLALRTLLSVPRVTSATIILLLSLSDGQGADLKYQFKQDQKFAFDVEIIGEVPGSVETHKGVAVFRVVRIADGSVQLHYKGGLKNPLSRILTGQVEDADSVRAAPLVPVVCRRFDRTVPLEAINCVDCFRRKTK